MSGETGDDQPAEIDGEYRCEEKRKQKALDSKHTAPKLTDQLLTKDLRSQPLHRVLQVRRSPTESIANSYQLTSTNALGSRSSLTSSVVS